MSTDLAILPLAYELPTFLGHVRILSLLGDSTPPNFWVYNSEHSRYLLTALLLISLFFFFSLLVVLYKSLHRSLTFPRSPFYDSVSVAPATVTDQTYLQTRL